MRPVVIQKTDVSIQLLSLHHEFLYLNTGI